MEKRVYVLPAAAPVMVEAYALDRLIAAGDGELALLYLYILRNGGRISLGEAAADLKREEDAVRQALGRLGGMGLLVLPAGLSASPPEGTAEGTAAVAGTPVSAGPAAAEPAAAASATSVSVSAPILEPEGPPEYSADDIARELESGSPFPGLVLETQRRLGRVLSSVDLKILFGLYDYLDLPAEVISLLVTYCAQEAAKAPGGGRPLRMRQVEKEAYAWKRKGVDTADLAVEHLKRLEMRREKSAEVLRALQIFDRVPAPSERKYIEDWLEMGFPPAAIALAYDRTVLQTGDLKWPYLNSILKSWHQKKLHTVAEIEAGDTPASKKSRDAAPPAAGSRDLETIAWMKELVRRQEREE